MKIKYNCMFTFSDEDGMFNHKQAIEIVLPESTYSVVKMFAFKQMSKLKLDIPKEFNKIDFEIKHQERIIL